MRLFGADIDICIVSVRVHLKTTVQFEANVGVCRGIVVIGVSVVMCSTA